jgi:hypothetical protein
MKGKTENRKRPPSPIEFDRYAEFVMDDDPDTKSAPTISNLDIDANQDRVDKDSYRFSHLSTVVTECLDLHERCTGSYVDSSGKYILRCHCLCHRGEDVLASVAKGDQRQTAEGDNLLKRRSRSQVKGEH